MLRKITPKTWFWLIFACGIVLSGYAAWRTHFSNQQQIDQITHAQAVELGRQLNQRFELFEYGLKGVRGYVLASGSDNINSSSFFQYMQTTDLVEEFPGALGMGFIRKVSNDELNNYQTQKRRTVSADFTIRQLEAHSGASYVIELIEPIENNETARGLDIGSEKSRRVAAEESSATGDTRITQPITLVQAQGNELQSFLMLLPVYNRWTTPATESLRKSSLIGWAYSPLIIEDVIAQIMQNPRFFNVELSDVADSKATTFYSINHGPRMYPSHLVTTDIFGRVWTIEVSADQRLVDDLNQWSPATVFLLSGLISLIVAASGFLYGVGKLAQLKKIESQRRLASIVENSVDAILMISRDGCILDVNKSAESLFTGSADDFIGKHIDVLGLSEHSQQSVLSSATAGKTVRHKELTYQSPLGKTAYLVMSAVPILNQRQRIVSVSIVFRDISDLKMINQRLVESKEQAEKASDAKSQFLANMSHELRTPMNASLGMLRLLKSTPLSNQQLDYALKAENAAQSLLNVLNDILDFSKIEAGKLTIDKQDFQLSELINHISNLLENNYADLGVEVVFDIEPDIPNCLHSDFTRLTQVMTNLVINAIKFTHQGAVVISIYETQRDAHQITLDFSVKDTGIGISTEQQKIIFDSFEQVQSSTSRQYGGAGLGLTIAKRLLSLLGTEMQLESELDVGSRFWFSLTMDYQNDNQHYLPPLPLKDLLKRVLIVDEQSQTMDLTSDLLQRRGVEVIRVSSAALAMEQLEQSHGDNSPFCLVVVDCRLHDTNGFELANKIRMHSKNQPSLRIVVTANYEQQLLELQSTYSATYDLLLIHPLPPQVIITKIADLFSTNAPVAVEYNQQQSVSAADKPLHGQNIMVVEDNELNRQVIDELLTLMGANVSLCHDGLHAVQTFRHLGERIDVVLMDIQMPDIDGYEATKRIREMPAGSEPLIIALTANVADSDKQLSLQAGMDAHVGKPIDIHQLIDAIVGLQVDKPAKNELLTLPLKTAPSVEQALEPSESILARFDHNEALVAKMVDSFCSETLQFLDSIRMSVEHEDAPALLKTLHAFKGVAATVGATYLAKTLLSYEQKAERSGTVFDVDIKALNDITAVTEAAKRALRKRFSNTDTALKVQDYDQTDPCVAPKELQKLLVLVKSNNLEAIQVSAKILRQCNNNFHINVIHEHIEGLEFQAASKKIRSLLEKVQGAVNV